MPGPIVPGLIALALALQSATLAIQPYVPLVDFPNHMARHVLEADWLQGHVLPSGYEIEYCVVPNLGGDLVVPLLLLVLEPGAACKVFLILSVLLYWLGPTLYILQANGHRFPALCAALLLLPLSFSSQFFWGFLNYYSGLGLAFVVLTHWLRLQRKPVIWEWVAHALLVALLFLWHLAPWGIYGVVAGSHLVVDLWRRRRAGIGWAHLFRRVAMFVLVCLPSLVLFAIYLRDKAGAAGLGETNWGTATRKLIMPLTLFRGYDLATDAIVIATWLLALGFLFAPRHLLRRAEPETRLAHAPNPPNPTPIAGNRPAHLLSITLLGLLYLAIPFQLGGTSDTDSRLLPAMLVCALAWAGSLPLRSWVGGLTMLASCLLVRQGAILVAWHELAHRLDVQAGAFVHLEKHSRVLPVVIVPEQSKNYPEQHFACWSVVTHRAFVPSLFAYRDQQPLVIRSPVRRPVNKTDRGWELDEVKVREHYDFVWLIDPEKKLAAVPPSFELLYKADTLELWRVR